VALAGGADALRANARAAYEAGDYRWVVEVVNHLVFAEPDNEQARELQARALEQLAYGSENATWRNFFLMGAGELRDGVAGTATRVPPDVIANISTSQLLDALAIQLDGPRARELALSMHWLLPDVGESHRLTLANGVLTHRSGEPDGEVDATVTIERSALNELLLGAAAAEDLLASGRLQIAGDAQALVTLMGLLDPPDPAFAIVTP
jgi:alkyl sulfatase BDS1-like metallo-beta-lactamase superfamily hydrolase